MPKTESSSRLNDILQRFEPEILERWVHNQLESMRGASGRIAERQVREESARFLSLLRTAVQKAGTDISGSQWEDVKGMLVDMSRARAQQGFTPSETATFVFSLKQPLFQRMREEMASDSGAVADEIWLASSLLDQLGLYTTEVFLHSREDVIRRQQQEMMELSTPVVKLWDGILALPLIGTLDSARTQVVMESLLDQIVKSGSTIAIIDITGVPTVDTLVAQHLLKTVAAARLMGAECIISGIRPQIAQTIVHLGVALGDVVTKATVADAFAVAMRRTRLQIVPLDGPGRQGGGGWFGSNGELRALRTSGSSGLPLSGSSAFSGGLE
jgi:rsbT co-antagonist protein RsbR